MHRNTRFGQAVMARRKRSRTFTDRRASEQGVDCTPRSRCNIPRGHELRSLKLDSLGTAGYKGGLLKVREDGGFSCRLDSDFQIQPFPLVPGDAEAVRRR